MPPMALLLGGLLGGALAALRGAADGRHRRHCAASLCCCPGGQNDHAESEAGTAHSGAVWLFGTMFLAGYLPGIWLGGAVFRRWGSSWRRIIQKSRKMQRCTSNFGTEFSVSFLQLTAAFLCGFCVLGVGLLALLFYGRGVFLGYCAASVAAVNGAAGLVQYRLETIVSDAATLLFLPVAGGLVGTPGRGTV